MCAIRAFVGEKRYTATHFHRVTLSPLAAISIRLSIRKYGLLAWTWWRSPDCDAARNAYSIHISPPSMASLLFGTSNRLRSIPDAGRFGCFWWRSDALRRFLSQKSQ